MGADDIAAHLADLLARDVAGGATVDVRDLESLPGGYSSAMTRFTAVIDGAPRVLVARRDLPVPMVESDRAREWEVLRSLTDLGTVPMPNVVCADPDGSLTGAATIILDFVDGESLLARAQAGTDDDHSVLVEDLARLAADIHAVDPKALAGLDAPPDWDSHIDRCIGEWRAAAAEGAENDPFFDYVAAWLDSHRPPPCPLGLVHGDLQSSNILIDRADRMVAVDWEFGHVGDPREDLGWFEMTEAFRPPAIVGPDEERFLAAYRKHSHLDADLVNPATVAYFRILPFGLVVRRLVRQIAAFDRGEQQSIGSAYSAISRGPLHGQWLQAIRAVEAAP